MRSRRHSADEEEAPDPDPEGEDPEEGPEEVRPRAHGRHRGRAGRPRTAAERDAVLPWDLAADEAAAGKDWRGRPKKPVYWRARDSLWFEPLVALMIVILLVVGLWAYTQNWPPLYVVESDSMQHGSNDVVGLINTGDLVLAQKIDPNSVTTYVVGAQTGYSTYGEYGDVILYHPNGVTDVTPVIHRAIIFLTYDGAGLWSFPSLDGLTCSTNPHPANGQPTYSVTGGTSPCSTSAVSGTLTLYNIGWEGARVEVPLSSMGSSSGFLTMGDNNLIPGHPPLGEPDQTYGISALVQPGWVLGVARGMIPWFGALKLMLQGQTSMVPSQSWELMGFTVAALLPAALGLHLALRRREEREAVGEDGEESRGGWFQGILHPREGGDDEAAGSTAEPDEGPARNKVRPIPKEKLLTHPRAPKGGRPRPKVRRPANPHGHRRGDDADDL